MIFFDNAMYKQLIFKALTLRSHVKNTLFQGKKSCVFTII
jgi:hypothetical protein